MSTKPQRGNSGVPAFSAIGTRRMDSKMRRMRWERKTGHSLEDQKYLVFSGVSKGFMGLYRVFFSPGLDAFHSIMGWFRMELIPFTTQKGQRLLKRNMMKHDQLVTPPEVFEFPTPSSSPLTRATSRICLSHSVRLSDNRSYSQLAVFSLFLRYRAGQPGVCRTWNRIQKEGSLKMSVVTYFRGKHRFACDPNDPNLGLWEWTFALAQIFKLTFRPIATLWQERAFLFDKLIFSQSPLSLHIPRPSRFCQLKASIPMPGM